MYLFRHLFIGLFMLQINTSTIITHLLIILMKIVKNSELQIVFYYQLVTNELQRNSYKLIYLIFKSSNRSYI